MFYPSDVKFFHIFFKSSEILKLFSSSKFVYFRIFFIFTEILYHFFRKNSKIFIFRRISGIFGNFPKNFIHFFYNVLNRAQNEYWIARIGATRRGSFSGPNEQLLAVDQIALHPEYIDTGYINDIALLRLETVVTFSDYVRPVCLPNSEPKSGTSCTVTGWGQLFEIGRIYRKFFDTQRYEKSHKFKLAKYLPKINVG